MSHTNAYQGATGARLNLALGNQVPVKVYQELDTKLDDGLPLTGVFRAALNTGAVYGAIVQGPAPGPTGCNLAPTANQWNIPADQQNCNAVFLY